MARRHGGLQLLLVFDQGFKMVARLILPAAAADGGLDNACQRGRMKGALQEDHVAEEVSQLSTRLGCDRDPGREP